MAGGGCGSWQAEITATTNKGGSCGASNHGCEYCEEPTPTPSYEAQCVQVQVLRGGVVINPSEITLGDSLTFRGFGATGDPTDSIDKIEFTVKKDGAVHTGPSEVAATKVGASWQADFPFTVSEVGSYNVIIRSHSLKYGWKD